MKAGWLGSADILVAEVMVDLESAAAAEATKPDAGEYREVNAAANSRRKVVDMRQERRGQYRTRALCDTPMQKAKKCGGNRGVETEGPPLPPKECFKILRAPVEDATHSLTLSVR